MPDVIALGELLIDFVSTASGVSLAAAPAFKKAPGGAPANVAVGLAKLGVSSGFMGKVGDDPFGYFLSDTLSKHKVDVSALLHSNEARTALAFVSLRADGERDFMFYRHPSADMLYRSDEVDTSYIREAKIFHFGSISLIGEPSRSATLHAVEVAHQSELIVSYDPNLRLNLWPDERSAIEGIKVGWPLAHVIKVSQEELAFLSGTDDLIQGARQLWHDDLRLLIVTKGREGSTFVTKEFIREVPGFQVMAVDTTGAGDGFVAGLLKGLLAYPQAWEDARELESICRYANVVGALTTTERGAIPALPTVGEVDEFLQRQ
ncbi:MAG: PfkB family carbohydrate kinase [Chloroflexota bacterium]|nr:PfkB family carbohydrate kinase [Chloroflexota bacterium]